MRKNLDTVKNISPNIDIQLAFKWQTIRIPSSNEEEPGHSIKIGQNTYTDKSIYPRLKRGQNLKMWWKAY